MKKMLALLVAVILLSGCGAKVVISATAVPPTAAPTSTPSIEPTPTAGLEAAEEATITSQLQAGLVCGSQDPQAIEYYNRAHQLQLQGDLQGAVPLYQRSIEFDPVYCDAMDNLGLILRQQGDVQGAIEWYLRSIDIAPDNSVARMNLAVAYNQQGRTSLAIEQYREIIARDPHNPEGYYGLAGIYQDQGKYEEAVPLYRQAVRWYEESGSYWVSDAYHGLGLALAALNRCPEAVETLGRVYDQFMYDPWVNYAIGACYLGEALNDPERADLYIARASFLGFELPEEIWGYLPSWDLQVGEDLGLVYGYFGLFEYGSEGPFFFPTLDVPYRDGLEYGWVIFLNTTHETVCWREEYEMPAPPRSWGDVEADGETTISEDGRTATTEFCQAAGDQIIGNSWVLTNGDPLGEHEIRIYVEGQSVTTFDFFVGLEGDGS